MEEIIRKSFSKKSSGPKVRINESIRHNTVRLIDDGEQIGIVSIKDALERAENKNLDLVEVSPNATPPVCKIIDYGKYKYELAKKLKDSKKKQHVVSLKTIRIMSVNIDTHDIEIKSNNARKFLEEGNKVKVFLQFKGREIVHRDMGFELLKTFFGFLEDIAKFDKRIESEGARRISMVLTKK